MQKPMTTTPTAIPTESITAAGADSRRYKVTEKTPQAIPGRRCAGGHRLPL